MAFELKSRETVPDGIRRIVRERIDCAMEMFNKGGKAINDHSVHEVRKRLKEIRGTLRLVRCELGEKVFARENRAYRDAGRPLSAVRDAKVLVDSFDKLIEHFDGRIRPRKLGWMRRALLTHQRATRKRILGRDSSLTKIVKSLSTASDRVNQWPLKRRGWKAIHGGLHSSYAKGRRAMKDVSDNSSDDTLHEWRKRTKDLRYQLELLSGLRSTAIETKVKQAHRLTDVLGEDQDLCVLGVRVSKKQRAKKLAVDIELIDALIAERRAALQKKARSLGKKLYEHRPRYFVGGLHKYWQGKGAK